MRKEVKLVVVKKPLVNKYGTENISNQKYWRTKEGEIFENLYENPFKLLNDYDPVDLYLVSRDKPHIGQLVFTDEFEETMVFKYDEECPLDVDKVMFDKNKIGLTLFLTTVSNGRTVTTTKSYKNISSNFINQIIAQDGKCYIETELYNSSEGMGEYDEEEIEIVKLLDNKVIIHLDSKE